VGSRGSSLPHATLDRGGIKKKSGQTLKKRKAQGKTGGQRDSFVIWKHRTVLRLRNVRQRNRTGKKSPWTPGRISDIKYLVSMGQL